MVRVTPNSFYPYKLSFFLPYVLMNFSVAHTMPTIFHNIIIHLHDRLLNFYLVFGVILAWLDCLIGHDIFYPINS